LSGGEIDKRSNAPYLWAVASDWDPLDPEALSRLYRERFADEDADFKARAWQILSDRVFQPYIGPDDTVVDLGAGRCEFINAIRCGSKIAVDLNPDVVKYAKDARVVEASSTDLNAITSGSVDVVFTSNFLEHLPTKAAVLLTLAECSRILRSDGTVIVLMPNIRYLPGRYWDFFDHHTPLTHVSLVEAMRLVGLVPLLIRPRFLPYTVNQRSIPRSTLLLRMYLSLPVLWPLFGRQMLVVARRATEDPTTS
jgi:SAM-dependent methyltransferase